MWSIGFPGAVPAKPMDAFALLERARALGAEVVQYGPNLPLDQLQADDQRRLVEAAQAAGIELEVGTRGLDPSTLRAQIALARNLGATLLRTVPDYAPDMRITAEQLASEIASVIPALQAAGVRLAIENAAIPARVLRTSLESLASPWVGVTLDTVNSLTIPEGTEEVAATLAPYTFCLHVKDFLVERAWHMMGFQVTGRPAGQGQLDVPRLLATLLAAGADPNAILELWPPAQAAGLEQTIVLEQAWALQSMAYLRTLLPGAR